MKVLFVCSGNSSMGISPIIENQANSLLQEGLEVDYYRIMGKGIKGYLQNIRPLRKCLQQQSYDIVHAHYSLSAFCASMAGSQSLVVSLMGSDVKAGSIYRLLIKLFVFFYRWKAVIVKSEDMRLSLGIKKTVVIPNGVNMEIFRPMDKLACQQQLDWDSSKKHILFPAHPQRYEKNYTLAETALQIINNPNIRLHYFDNLAHTQTPIWYNAADVVLLTSLWEGSPNAIKEAMACARPIVCTPVGDVAWLFDQVEGCYLSSFQAKELAADIQKALAYTGTIESREKLLSLQIDSQSIAKKIKMLYMQL